MQAGAYPWAAMRHSATQYYTYDDVGNIMQLQHVAGSGSYTRDYNYSSSSNRLETTVVGSSEYTYEYDDRGNMVAMPHLAAMDWNVDNELQAVSRGGRNNWYQYSGGQRTRKYLDKGSYKEERIYFGSFEIYRKFDNASSLIVERQTVHVSDDTGRIAMLEKRTIGSAVDDNDTLELLTRYIYSNHLQSASLELDETAGIISYEEYHPYGTTAYQANSTTIAACAKRYRYTGKERDEESGLYYHGARYYVPWLGRWTACDPLESKYSGMSPYNYSFNNPVMFNDPSGADPTDPPKSLNAVDNTAIAPVIQQNNLFPFTSPTGGSFYLPTSAADINLYDSRPILSGGQILGNPVEGSVENFSYLGETYQASYGFETGEFAGYYSQSDSSHFLNAYLNTMPSPPEDPIYKLATGIEGGGRFLLGAAGAVLSGAFTAATAETGIGAVVGWAGMVYNADQASAGFSQMVSGESTQTYVQRGLGGLGLSPDAVAAVDMTLGVGLNLGATTATAAPVYNFSNVATKGGGRAFWSGPGTESKALADGFETLGQTRAGKNLIKLTEGMPYFPAINGQPASQAYQWWAKLSIQYAKGASGSVRVYQLPVQQVGNLSIWRLYEYTALKSNTNVTNIIFDY